MNMFPVPEKKGRRISRTLKLITMVPLPMDLAGTRTSIQQILRNRKIDHMKATIGR